MQQLHAFSTCQWPRSPPAQVRRLEGSSSTYPSA